MRFPTIALALLAPLAWADVSGVEALQRETEQVVARVLEAHPESAAAHALSGELHAAHGRPDQARRAWERALELDPRRADIHRALAEMAWDAGEFERTTAACRRALAIDPSLPGVDLLLGRSLLELGKIAEAIAVLEPAVKRSGSGHHNLASAYMQADAFEKARESYLRAVAEHPNYAQAHYGLAMASLRLGRTDEARQYQQRFRQLSENPEAVKARKRDPRRLGGLGEARNTAANLFSEAAGFYRSRNETEQAERLWQRAAMLDPYHFPSREALLAIYRDGARADDALAFFEQLAAIPSTNPWDHLYLGHLHTTAKRYDEAERVYLNLTRYAPERPDGYEALVELYLHSGKKLPEARSIAAKAVALRPSPQNHFLLAQVSARIGERAAALTAIERALALEPGNATYRALHDRIKVMK